MRNRKQKEPSWKIGFYVWLIYCAIIFGIWAIVGADYSDLASREVILQRLVLPEALGAAVLILAVSRLGWWQAVLREDRRGHPKWTMWVLLPVLACFISVLAGTTAWSSIAPLHLALIFVATALIGFNEEILTRGVLIVSARGSWASEGKVWLFSAVLFGLMHVPNGFFGIGLSASTTQAAFTFLLGSGLYLLRRVSGSIVLPIVVHTLWDFSTFSHEVTSTGVPLLATMFQLLCYLTALILVAVLLRHDRKARIARLA